MPPSADNGAAASNSSRPRRRWSDGPNYPWSTATDEQWAVGEQWPALVALLCDQVAGGSTSITQELDRLHKDGRLSGTEVAVMEQSAETMRASGLAVQQIVRLGAGFVRHQAERVDLTRLARQTVQERQPELTRRRALVDFDIRPAEVSLDPTVAVALMNTGLDWALSFSSGIRIKIEQAESAAVRLIVRGALPPPAKKPAYGASGRRQNRRMNDNLHWILLRQIAASCKLGLSRSSTGATESAVIEFPKSFQLIDGLSSVELLAGGDVESELQDAWVLAIVRDRALRETVLKVMLRNGLDASVAENCEQARQLCAERSPKVLVGCYESIGVPQLRGDLALEGRACPLIQIVRMATTFADNGFGGHEFVKVGRAELAKDLVPAVLFELAQQG